MPINFTSFEAKLQTKLDAITASSSETEMLLLSKTVEAAIANITISDIQSEGTTQVNAVNTAATTKIGLVNTAGTTQVTAVNTAGNTYYPTMDAASAGKFLTNNGAAGVKSWAPINVNNITGNLDVAGNITSTGIVDGQRIDGYPSNINTGSPAGDVTRMAGRFSGAAGVGNGGAIAFDYGSVTTGFPACIGYAIEDNGGHTKGGIVFKTRNSTGINDLPTERMRIAADGTVTIPNLSGGGRVVNFWERNGNAQITHSGGWTNIPGVNITVNLTSGNELWLLLYVPWQDQSVANGHHNGVTIMINNAHYWDSSWGIGIPSAYNASANSSSNWSTSMHQVSYPITSTGSYVIEPCFRTNGTTIQVNGDGNANYAQTRFTALEVTPS